jgi:hypothetical protein
MPKRQEHCAFAVTNHTGKCIALCSKNTEDEDCIGIKHETIHEYRLRIEDERRKI